MSHLEFNKELFFTLFLPLIIFATGFNMRRQKFFENIANVSKFGLLGTILTFIFYSIMTYVAVNNFEFQVKDNVAGDTFTLALDIT